MHRGDIYWHALPFNGQLEFFDVSLLEFAVQLTHELDVKFGLPPKRTMSQVGSSMQRPTPWAGASQACFKHVKLITFMELSVADADSQFSDSNLGTVLKL